MSILYNTKSSSLFIEFYKLILLEIDYSSNGYLLIYKSELGRDNIIITIKSVKLKSNISEVITNTSIIASNKRVLK